MTDIPIWWVAISGLFFIVNTIFFIGLTVALYKIVKIMQELQPKVEDLTVKVNGLVGTLKMSRLSWTTWREASRQP